MITINKASCLDAPIKVDALNGVAFTKEQGAHKFVVSCYQNGEKLNLEGTITGKFTCHGRTIEIALDYAGIDVSGNAWVILSQHCYDYAGRFQLAILNTVGDTTFCIYACVGNVQISQIGNPVDGGEIIDSIETLIQEIQTAVRSIPPTYTELVSRVDNLKSAVADYNAFINLDKEAAIDYWIVNGLCINADTGATKSNSDYNITNYIDVSGIKKIRYAKMTTTGTKGIYRGLAFYTEKNEESYISGERELKGQSAYSYVDSVISVPATAKWARFTMYSAGSSFYAYRINIIADVLESLSIKDTITHENINDIGVLNCIKRARQISDFKWTPMMKIPRYSMMSGSTVHWLDWFNAETEYTGIPYSGGGESDRAASYDDPTSETPQASINPNCDAGKWGYRHMFVGLGVPFEAFVTAARYPNSIMGERVNQSTASFDSSLYGSVCSALISYAFNLSGNVHYIRSGFFENWDNKFTRVAQSVASMDISSVHLCDAVEIGGSGAHIAMVTDLIRDKNGAIEYIEATEATTVGNGNNNGQVGSQLGGKARRRFYTVDGFKARYGSYSMWRLQDFSTIQYDKSPFVTVGNEAYMEPEIDYPCIPYLGSGARYKVGYIYNSKVLIGAKGFTQLVVLKDGEAFNTFAIDENTEYVNVGFSAVGEYEAYLKKDDVVSMSCHWSVIEDDGR